MMRKLDEISGLNPPDTRWMMDGDAGPSYCPACAEKKAAETNDRVDGGYRVMENDGCCHCDGCGALLTYTLTEYGVSEELFHFQRRRFRKPLHPEVAYHVARLVEAAPGNPKVLKIAARAIAAATYKASLFRDAS